jgi:hypothetical protein
MLSTFVKPLRDQIAEAFREEQPHIAATGRRGPALAGAARRQASSGSRAKVFA